MKVFDFDNTIYRGESPVHFAFYMIKHNKKIKRYIPTILLNLVGYKLCLLKKEKLEATINNMCADVLDGTTSLLDYVKPFWELHVQNLNQEMLALVEPDDVILTASPVFLINGLRGKLNTEHIVGTEVDFEQKKIVRFNFGDNKVERYKELYSDREIDAFYTDSYNDKYMMEISNEVFIVKKGIPVKKT